jgi:hypothetical protein
MWEKQSDVKVYLFKGTVSRDFLPLFFFHESVSTKPLIKPLGPFKIFSKIFLKGLPPVSLSVATEKNLQSEIFLGFLLDTFG